MPLSGAARTEARSSGAEAMQLSFSPGGRRVLADAATAAARAWKRDDAGRLKSTLLAQAHDDAAEAQDSRAGGADGSSGTPPLL